MVLRQVVAVEDAFQTAVARVMRRLGRPLIVQPFPAYGGKGWARVGGRVVFATYPRLRRRPATLQALQANLRQFRTVEVPYAPVLVSVGDHTVRVRADREGYVDVVVAVDLPPGASEVAFVPDEPGAQRSVGKILVPDPAARVGVVSDIDDTIVDSGIARGLVATVTTALLRDAASRVPLEGAAPLYRALAADGGAPERPFFYLSTSPWNLASFLAGFLDSHGFPPGPLLLTDWGPGSYGLLRVGTQRHKLTSLRRLAAEFPQLRFVLIGDSGQEDAEIYTAYAREAPHRVTAIYIRQAGVLAELKSARLADCGRTCAELDVPFVVVEDSAGIEAHARESGLVGAGAAQAVAASIRAERSER